MKYLHRQTELVKENGCIYRGVGVGGSALKLILFPSKKGSTLKGKNLFPLGVHFCLTELNPLEEVLCEHKMNKCMTKTTKRLVRPAKTQISLRIHAV